MNGNVLMQMAPCKRMFGYPWCGSAFSSDGAAAASQSNVAVLNAPDTQHTAGLAPVTTHIIAPRQPHKALAAQHLQLTARLSHEQGRHIDVAAWMQRCDS